MTDEYKDDEYKIEPTIQFAYEGVFISAERMIDEKSGEYRYKLHLDLLTTSEGMDVMRKLADTGGSVTVNLH